MIFVITQCRFAETASHLAALVTRYFSQQDQKLPCYSNVVSLLAVESIDDRDRLLVRIDPFQEYELSPSPSRLFGLISD